jgi:hypothetical protein
MIRVANDSDHLLFGKENLLETWSKLIVLTMFVASGYIGTRRQKPVLGRQGFGLNERIGDNAHIDSHEIAGPDTV